MYSDKGFFMYMEYVAGGTLDARISELGKLDHNVAMIYTKQMLQGLVFMHENQVIHRDLKPANVLISVDGTIKLADFGTAFDLSELTHTAQQTLCGTPAYIAPEELALLRAIANGSVKVAYPPAFPRIFREFI